MTRNGDAPSPFVRLMIESHRRLVGRPLADEGGLPSRLTAEAPDRAERQRLLDAVTRDGFVENYRGLRIAKSGRRFWIEDVTVWTLRDAEGVTHGQAAAYRRWRDA